MKKVLVKKKIDTGTPLSVVNAGGAVAMLSRIDKKTASSLVLSWSVDGTHFELDNAKVSITVSPRKKEVIKSCDRFSLSRTPNGFVLVYVRLDKSKSKTKRGDMLVVARSKDMTEWKVMSEMPAEGFHRATVVYDRPQDAFELYTDGLFVRGQSSTSLAVWKKKSSLLFTARRGEFDADQISIIGSFVAPQGILVAYDASIRKPKQTLLQAGAVLFDVNNPKRIIWRSEVPVWQGVVETKTEDVTTHPIGFISHGDKFMIYWVTNTGDLIVAIVPALFKELEDARNVPKILERFHGNPIMEPRVGHAWEGEGTFNPTVIQDDDGVVHLLYRALGNDGISRVGYAQSIDGMYFDRRSAHPVFEARMGYGLPDPGKIFTPTNYNPAMYISGGSWSGAEDPRATKIGDTVYMMYTAFEGWNSMRIALTSISVENFKEGRWHWKKPKLISSPRERAKNWSLFPEKINGKFAVLHSIAPLAIDYVDDIDTFNGIIESPRPEGPQQGRKGKWDNLLRGAGPAPVKTELGWLVLYHALDKRDSSRYKLGAMILGENDPTKILYRSAHPILSPDMHYENEGKPGIVYASGATIKGDDLYVYYGGGDRVVCIAKTPLKEFLKYLVTGRPDAYELKKATE